MSSGPTPTLADIHAEIDRWFAEEIQRAPVSYLTETYNQVHEAVLGLKTRIAALIEPEAQAVATVAEEIASEVAEAAAPEPKKSKPAA